MIPELGHVSLIIAFALAIGLAAVPMWGALRRDIAAMNTAPSLAVGVTVFVGIAFALLAVSFLQDDFSVAVVAANSNSLLPPIFKFSAVWGNHEGSLLLWVLILSGWMTAVAYFSRGLPLLMVARVLSVMGMVAVFRRGQAFQVPGPCWKSSQACSHKTPRWTVAVLYPP